MKKLFMLVALIAILIGVSSCQIHSPMATNLYQNATNVVLQDNNYKIVEKVSGDSQANYLFYFGGIRKKGLIEVARAEMLENANLVGSSRAVINETVETSVTSFLGVYNYVKVRVSGYVIEFTE